MDYHSNIQTTDEPLLSDNPFQKQLSPVCSPADEASPSPQQSEPMSPGTLPSDIISSPKNVAIPILGGNLMLRGKHSRRVAASKDECAAHLEKVRLQKQRNDVVERIFPNEERVMQPMNIRRLITMDPKTMEVLTDSTMNACLEITPHRILFASGYVVPGMSENNNKAEGKYDVLTDLATVTCTHEQKFTAWNLPLTHVLNVELDTSLGIKSVKTIWSKRRVWVAVLAVILMLIEIGLVLLLSNRQVVDIVGGATGFVVMGLIGASIYYFWTKFFEVPTQTSSVEQKVLSISCISPTTFQPTITKIEFCFNTTNSNDLVRALNFISPKPGRAPVICAGNVTQIKIDHQELTHLH